MSYNGPWQERPTHPYANVFPEQSDVEFSALKEDIKANGLLCSILVDSEGKILDGRHRQRACIELGIEPKYEECVGSGPSLLNKALSLNLLRRNLTTSQRAIAAARFVEEQKKLSGSSAEMRSGAPGKTSEIAAATFGVSTRLVEDALKVIRVEYETLTAAITKGKLRVTLAAKLAHFSNQEIETALRDGPEAIQTLLASTKKRASRNQNKVMLENQLYKGGAVEKIQSLSLHLLEDLKAVGDQFPISAELHLQFEHLVEAICILLKNPRGSKAKAERQPDYEIVGKNAPMANDVPTNGDFNVPPNVPPFFADNKYVYSASTYIEPNVLQEWAAIQVCRKGPTCKWYYSRLEEFGQFFEANPSLVIESDRSEFIKRTLKVILKKFRKGHSSKGHLERELGKYTFNNLNNNTPLRGTHG